MLRLTVSAAALLIAGPAFASGYVAPPAPLPPVVPVIEQDWTGFYIGGQIDLIADSSVELNGFQIGEYEGELYGIFAGYRYDLGDFVVGGEFDYMVGSIDAIATTQGFTGTTDNDVTLIRAGVEGGYDLGDALIYGAVGFANLESDDANVDSDGYFIGSGVDYRLTDNIILGAEVNYHVFEEDSILGPVDSEITTFGLNLAFTF